MSVICDITKKKVQFGGKYRNRVRANKYKPVSGVVRKPNISKKRIFVPELGKTFVVKVSARGLRIINKKGAYTALKEAGIIK